MPDKSTEVYSITFPGRVLERGFWLYVIDIHAPQGRFLYVGRTGDSSSANAGSPFSRIGQHLDHRVKARGNALARNLRQVGVEPSQANLEMIALGPIFPEEREFGAHRIVRDRIAALEHGLACALRERGHNVIGKHSKPCEPDKNRLDGIVRLVEERLGKRSFDGH